MWGATRQGLIRARTRQGVGVLFEIGKMKGDDWVHSRQLVKPINILLVSPGNTRMREAPRPDPILLDLNLPRKKVILPPREVRK